MKTNQDAIRYLLTKLKWAEMDAAIALKNGNGGVVNYMHGQAWAYKAMLWDLYGIGNDEAERIVALELSEGA
jgi:hypothetical protein